MKFTCERSAILAAAETVGRRAKSKSPIPILSNILITARKKRVSLLGHDIDHCCSAAFDAEVGGDGATAVEAPPFIALLRGFVDGAHVECELTESGLKVKCGRGKYVLRVMPPTDFPDAFSAGKDAKPFRLSLDAVKNLFDRPSFAVYTKNDRLFYMGVFFHVDEDAKALAAVTSDGNQMMFVRERAAEIDGILPPESGDQGEKRLGVIIPLSAMLEIVKLAADGEVEIACSKSIIEIRAGSVIFASKLIDAIFPAFRKFVDSIGTELSFVVKREDLKAAVQRLSSLSEASISLSWKGGAKEITIGLGRAVNVPGRAVNPPGGDGVESIEAECVGAPATAIHIAAHYLAPLVDAFSGEKIIFETSGVGESIRVRDPDDGDAVALQAPVGN